MDISRVTDATLVSFHRAAARRGFMDEQTAKKLRTRAFATAKKMYGRKGESPEDLAQDVMLSFAERPKMGQTVTQAVIDAYRKGNGRDENKCSHIRRMLQKKACEVTVQNGGSIEQVHQLDWDYLTAQLNSRDRALVILSFKWGFTPTELGEVFGLNTEYVSQMKSQILQTLEKIWTPT